MVWDRPARRDVVLEKTLRFNASCATVTGPGGASLPAAPVSAAGQRGLTGRDAGAQREGCGDSPRASVSTYAATRFARPASVFRWCRRWFIE